ncbi:TonB family protein [Hymenobacter gummosus]|uniref:TonB family protein n=1 Tax=Hymenobacter gummosus TaxID=1776032 RepID=A0A431U9H8_9BACT|nr:TonB family protein [Hymenobacter gummosus]RTQ53688.1 TonB family protein [Hymenobacter gummosus]
MLKVRILRLAVLATVLMATGAAAQAQTKPAARQPIRLKLPAPPIDTARVYTYVEQMPQPPGGMEGLMQYLGKNVKLPHHYTDNTKVYVRFTVRADGRISNVHVAKENSPEPDPRIEAEAVRVIRQMPPWTPGRQAGQPVKVAYTVPITFCYGLK